MTLTGTTGTVVLPKSDKTAASETIDRTYDECSSLWAAHRFAELVVQAKDISLFVNRADATKPNLISIRLWTVEALIKLGRGSEARTILEFLENVSGKSFRTRELYATLCLYAGDYRGCADACADAILAAPLDKARSKEQLRLILNRAEALRLDGRIDEARRSLFAALRDVVPTAPQLAALRRTIDSEAALESFFRFLGPHFTYPGHRARHALLQYSIACRDNGRIESAIFAARQRFLNGAAIVQFGARSRPEAMNWTSDAATALLDLRSDFAATGVEFFLISGTFLGCWREGGILGHDKDIDVGVETEIPLSQLSETIVRSGRFKPGPSIPDENMIQVQHANGVNIDIFRHWRDAGRIYHAGRKARWWNSEFDLIEADFLGHSFKIPDQADRYLTENYGSDWSVPQPEFETFVDTPNMIVHDPQHMLWYYYVKLHDYYFDGKIVQLDKIWRALQSAAPFDGAVNAVMSKIYETQAGPGR